MSKRDYKKYGAYFGGIYNFILVKPTSHLISRSHCSNNLQSLSGAVWQIPFMGQTLLGCQVCAVNGSDFYLVYGFNCLPILSLDQFGVVGVVWAVKPVGGGWSGGRPVRNSSLV